MVKQVSKMAISHVPGSTYQILRESSTMLYVRIGFITFTSFVAFSWQYLIRCISLLHFAWHATKQVYFSLFIVLTVHISLLIYSKYSFYSVIRSYKSQHDLNSTLLFTTSPANNKFSKCRYLLPYFCYPLWCMIFLFQNKTNILNI